MAFLGVFHRSVYGITVKQLCDWQTLVWHANVLIPYIFCIFLTLQPYFSSKFQNKPWILHYPCLSFSSLFLRGGTILFSKILMIKHISRDIVSMDVTGSWKILFPASLFQTVSKGTGSLMSWLWHRMCGQSLLLSVWFWRNTPSQLNVRIGIGNLAESNTVLMARFKMNISILVPEYSN